MRTLFLICALSLPVTAVAAGPKPNPTDYPSDDPGVKPVPIVIPKRVLQNGPVCRRRPLCDHVCKAFNAANQRVSVYAIIHRLLHNLVGGQNCRPSNSLSLAPLGNGYDRFDRWAVIRKPANVVKPAQP